MYTLTKCNSFSRSTATDQQGSSSSLSHNMNIEIEGSEFMGSTTCFSSSGSGCSSHVGSPCSNSLASCINRAPNTAINLLQKSISSHALYRVGSYCPFGLSEDSEDGPVRRAYSADDLMGVGSYMTRGKWGVHSPVSTSKENSMIIEGMLMKARRYSPEEKWKRIEKYRSKRNLRNFKKKIQYECRKTLADGRTRFKGRFVRKEEISTMMMMIMEDNISYDNYPLNDHYSSTHHHHMMARGDENNEGEQNIWYNLLSCED